MSIIKIDPVKAAPDALAYTTAFNAHLDQVAQAKGYDNRVTITTYVASANPQWMAEASAFIAWRDAALSYLFNQLTEFENGSDQPSISEFIDSLPLVAWPDVTAS